MNDDKELKLLKEEVALLGPATPSRRYPAELKERVATWARAQRAQGLRAKELEKAVGIPWESLGRWMRGAPEAEQQAAPRLRPVRVVHASALRLLNLRTPTGYVVEGLDVAALLELLSRLG